MSYEDAPATKMLATHCAVCSRPLLDSISVECGMGPTCRERHGYDEEVAGLPVEDRRAANVIVCRIAMAQDDEAQRAAGCAALLLLGFKKLAERIEFRGKERPVSEVRMRLSTKGTGWYVKAPWVPAAVDSWRGIPGRKWDGEAKENFVPTSARPQLWELLRVHYAGCKLVLPDGSERPIPAPAGRDEAVAEYVRHVKAEDVERAMQRAEAANDRLQTAREAATNHYVEQLRLLGVR